jgi:hypothetical protein
MQESFEISSASRLFHGVIAATTPFGPRTVDACRFGTLLARVSPSGTTPAVDSTALTALTALTFLTYMYIVWQ